MPLPPLGWVVQGVVPRHGVGYVAGPSSTGKSYLALDLAGAVMLGTEFMGHEIKKTGGVLWLAAETPQHVPNRLEAWWQAKVGDSQQLPFAHVIKVPMLTDPKGVDEIRVTCQAYADEIKAKFGADLCWLLSTRSRPRPSSRTASTLARTSR